MNIVTLTEKEKLYLEIATEKKIVIDDESFIEWLEISQIDDEFILVNPQAIKGKKKSQFIKFEGPIYDPNNFEPRFGFVYVN